MQDLIANLIVPLSFEAIMSMMFDAQTQPFIVLENQSSQS